MSETVILEEKPAKGTTRDNILDAVIFVLITILACTFSVGRIEKGDFDVAYMNLYDGLRYAPQKTPALWMFLIPFILYIGLLAWWFHRAYRRQAIRGFGWVGMLFTVFAVYRIIACFAFPYGETTWEYHAFDGDEIAVTYQGFQIGERFLTLAEELCFYGYFFFFLAFYKTLDRTVVKAMVRIIDDVVLVFVSSILLYSVFSEMPLILHNIKVLTGAMDDVMMEIRSYVTHRNVIGFFLLLASVISVRRFIADPKPYWLVILVIGTAFTAVINSRTSLLLSVDLVLGLMVLYPITHFRKHQGYSITMLAGIVLVLLLGFLAFLLHRSQFTVLMDRLFNAHTLDTRSDLRATALSMLNSPYLWLFGYTRYPFLSIFAQYKMQVPVDVYITNAHCSYVNLMLESGLTGLLLALVMLLGFAITCFYRTFKDKDPKYLFYVLGGTVLLIHSYLEMNMMFCRELTSLFYWWVFLYPVCFDFRVSQENNPSKTFIGWLNEKFPLK